MTTYMIVVTKCRGINGNSDVYTVNMQTKTGREVVFSQMRQTIDVAFEYAGELYNKFSTRTMGGCNIVYRNCAI